MLTVLLVSGSGNANLIALGFPRVLGALLALLDVLLGKVHAPQEIGVCFIKRFIYGLGRWLKEES